MASISKIRKRDGQLEDFDQEKITSAVQRAFFEVGIIERKEAEKVSDEVVRNIQERFYGRIPSVEDVQDMVENVLLHVNKRAWQAYKNYRNKKNQIRKLKKKFGFAEKLSFNAMTLLEERYLLRDETGKITETPEDMFRRVARAIAAVEKKYANEKDVKKLEEEFYEIMGRLEFLPNSPSLFNAGTRLGGLSACYVLPVEDSLESIFDAIKNMVLIEQTGGGVGFDFSRLRPKDDLVCSTKGVASGPVSFMRVFDIATDVIKAGGKRRGAMMGILRVDHPDILDFITSKAEEGSLSNFNISVAVTEKFMRAVKQKKNYELVNPRTGKVVKKLSACWVWNLIAENAWKTGDPGVIFIDEINKHNPTPEWKIESTNPCGEFLGLPYESCNLGSINLTKILVEKNGKYRIDWNKLRKIVRLGVHFLDNVIDANKFPLPEIEKVTKANRKIGLGVMGFAEFLILLGIKYDSEEALKIGEKVMRFISAESKKASAEIAAKKGSFPNIEKSVWKGKVMRNATTTAIAPTGSISIIAGCSSGIEPLFSVCFVRNVLGEKRLLEINPIFEKISKERGFYSADLLIQIAKNGSVRNADIPDDVKRVFVTALEIDPSWHIRMQAAFQKWTDNAVSKTINLPSTATKEDVRKAFELAHKLKCKGITVYRYGSKPKQVLSLGAVEKGGEKFVLAEHDYSGGCLKRVCPRP